MSTNFVGDGGLMSVQIRWIEIPHSSSGLRRNGVWLLLESEKVKYRNTESRNAALASAADDQQQLFRVGLVLLERDEGEIRKYRC